MTDKTPAQTCPEARISSPTTDRNGRAVVDVNQYTPYFLSAVNNKLSRGASQLYLDRFDIGIADWRVISMLAIEPWIPATRICQVVGLDKGATSRSLSKLSDQGIVDHETSEQDIRRRTWALNAKGYALHDAVLAVALDRERALITGVDPQELEVFLKVMRQMNANLANMD